MSEWRESKIGSLIKMNPETMNAKSNFAYIQYLDTGNIYKGKINEITRIDLTNEKPPSRAKRIVRNDDIIYSTVRPANEHYGIIKRTIENLIVSTGFAVLRTDKKKIDNMFLYYFLTLRDNIDYLSNIAEDSTSAYPAITPQVIEDLDIMYPEVQEQHAIAEVLSSLDDKIDLLSRQNKTLEALASTYFRQWFIEEANDEWEEKQLNKIGKIVCGKTPSTKVTQYFGGNIPFIKIPDMHNKVYVFDANETLSELGARSQANKTIPPFSINVSCIATVGLVTMNVYHSQTNQQINTVIPFEDTTRYFLFLFLKCYYEELQALGSGGTMTLNINTTLFGEITLAIPPNNLLKKFNDIVAPLFEKIHGNAKQINTLQKLRDTLLPKLISGEVRVTV